MFELVASGPVSLSARGYLGEATTAVSRSLVAGEWLSGL